MSEEQPATNETPSVRMAAWHAAWVPTMFAIIVTVGGAISNFAITGYRVSQVESELKTIQSERSTSMTANNEWKRAEESRLSAVEARETDSKAQLDRIEAKLDSLETRLIR